jgi:hypothetical protein
VSAVSAVVVDSGSIVVAVVSVVVVCVADPVVDPVAVVGSGPVLSPVSALGLESSPHAVVRMAMRRQCKRGIAA